MWSYPFLWSYAHYSWSLSNPSLYWLLALLYAAYKSEEAVQTLREKRNLLSVAGFAESQNSDTRQSLSLPSVAVGKDLHLAKSGFAECQKEPGTRQRAALSKGILCRVQHSVKKGTQQNKSNLTATRRTLLKNIYFT